ncbi:MAG: radical SAM protein [Nanoarchaeota archaeon]|nr:radical SAM protein [Nanoarchaeota archaeon]
MDLNNAGHLKIKLLVDGMRLSEEASEGLGKKWQEKIYSYSLTDWIDKKIILPSDIKLEDKVFVGFRFNPNSEWELDREDSERFVKNINTGLRIPASLIPRSSYYDWETSDGKKMQAIGVSCGNHGVSFFVNSYCEYFRNGENCKFCGLVPTQKKFSDSVKFKKVDQVQETIKAILNSGERVDFIQLSGGSMYNHNAEVRTYLPYISAIHQELAKEDLEGKIPIHLTCMPPFDLKIFRELKLAGLNTISFDLECPTQKYFKKYCPGKTKSYGYSGIRDALSYAKEVFGNGKVFSIVILGIEPRESFVSSLEEVIKDGIVPTLNIYHYDPLCSKDMDVTNPDPEELIKTAQEVAELFRRYRAVPGNLGCAHYDIGHEIIKGYF